MGRARAAESDGDGLRVAGAKPVRRGRLPVLPMLVVVWLSLHRWDLLGPIEYVGLANWRSVLSDATFGNSLAVTVLFVALVVPVQSVLGLAAAALLARGLPGTGLFRTLYVLPWICSPLAIAMLWRWILAPTDGAVSTVLGQPHRMADRSDAGASRRVGRDVWTNVGYVTLVLPRRNTGDPHRRPRCRQHRRRERVATLPAHHAADAAAHGVLRSGDGNRQRRTGIRHRLRADGRRPAEPNRFDRTPHLCRGVRRGSNRAGGGDGLVLFVLLVGITIVQQRYFRRRITYDLT